MRTKMTCIMGSYLKTCHTVNGIAQWSYYGLQNSLQQVAFGYPSASGVKERGNCHTYPL